MSKEWNEFNRFEQVNDKYLPVYGEGETMATQVATAVNKLVYKWYNDGDVYDNVSSMMTGWCNDLSSYANWLHGIDPHVVEGRKRRNVVEARNALEKVFGCSTESQYEDILFELSVLLLDEDVLDALDEHKAVGSVYKCNGPFEFREEEEEDEEDEWWEDEEDEDEDEDDE